MRKMRNILCLCAAFVLLTFSGCASGTSGSSQGSQDSSWEQVASDGTLQIGIDEAFYPMSYNKDDGTPTGFFIDIATEACRRLEVEPEFIPIVWEDAGEMLSSGEIDCIWGDCSAASDAKTEELSYSEPFLQGSQVVVCLSETGIRNLADLSGQRIGARKSSCGLLALEESTAFRNSLASVSVYDSYDDAKTALDNKKISAVVMGYAAAQYYQNEQPDTYTVLERENGSAEVLAEDSYCVSFLADAEALNAKVQGVLRAMKDDGTLDTYSAKWFGA